MKKSTAGKKKIVIIAAFVILIAVMAAMFMIVRYTPTKEKMNGYTYFDLDQSTDKTMVIVDEKQYSDTGIVSDGRHYLPQEFVADNINAGFYYDKESQAVLYSDSSYMYTYMSGENVYTDDTGKTYNTDYPVVIDVDGKCFIAWEYVAEHTDCEYSYGSEPERINISIEREARQCVTAKKKTAVRYRGGIKSPVLENVAKGDRLEFVENIDEAIVLHPMERRLVPTGLYMALPAGYEAQIRPRSGLALKHGITVLNTPGTIDADYRGEIMVLLINFSTENFVINDGERIAQMVLAKHEQCDFIEVNELDETERGAGGYGHTGVK